MEISRVQLRKKVTDKLTGKKVLGIVLFFLALSFIYILPYFPWDALAFTKGQDGRFQLSRIDELYQQLRQGPFITYISLHTFSEIGYGVNFFYPFLMLIPAALIRLLVSNPFQAYYLFIAAYTFATFLIAFFCMHDFSKNIRQSIIFSVIYGFAGFRAIDVFSRNALGEAIAITFLPLVFLGFYHILYGDRSKWYLLAVGMALLINTHLLTVFMTALIFLVILLPSLFFITDFFKRLQAGFKSVLLTILLSLNFFVPFLDQYLYTKMVGVTKFDVTEKSYPLWTQLQNSFSGTYEAWYDSYNLGTIIIILTLLGLFLYFKVTLKYRLTLFLGLFALILSTSAFPWEWFKETPIAIVQFPWRFLVFATFFFAIYSSGAVEAFLSSFRSKDLATILSAFLILSAIFIHGIRSSDLKHINEAHQGTHLYYDLNEENFDDVLRGYLNRDYLPTKSEKEFRSIYRDEIFVDGQKSSDIKKTIKPRAYNFAFNLEKTSTVDFPMLIYKNMWVYDNGKPIPWETSERGTVQVKLDKGKHSVSIGNSFTTVYKIAWLVSGVSWFVLLLIILKKNHGKRSKLEMEVNR